MKFCLLLVFLCLVIMTEARSNDGTTEIKTPPKISKYQENHENSQKATYEITATNKTTSRMKRSTARKFRKSKNGRKNMPAFLKKMCAVYCRWGIISRGYLGDCINNFRKPRRCFFCRLSYRCGGYGHAYI